ncbi:EAL domain-containing protein [Microvirga sp. BSC39]|uniref:bifunctional diguanylate cyclase/phosphodiesterase n=1 Tax=Microvirga sp. BSC39 TaxID=1549810 RepID=UPI000691FA85|nr:EAL domain-containing protein [Microvirga sp. BSC39]
MTGVTIENSCPTWREADRLSALRDFDVLDTQPEAAIDNLTKIASNVCEAPIALVSLIDEKRQWLKCTIGISGVQETPRDVAFCAHTILQRGILVVPDTTQDPRFQNNPFVTGEPHLRFYAAAPLVTKDGLPLGTLCVIDFKPRPDGLTREQSETLLALAQAVMSQLELKRSHKAVAESEERHRALIEASSAMVWRAAPDGSILEGWGWETFCGQTPEAFRGYGWLDNVHPEDREHVVEVWQRARALQEPCENEYRVRRLDGTFRWVLARGVPLKSQDGSIREWVGTLTDIHEQNVAAERLRSSEARYRGLVDASATVVWRAAPDGQIIEASSGWETISGQAPEAFKDYGWLEAVHPDDRERVVGHWQQVLASGQPSGDEFRVRHVNGEYRWFVTRTVPLFNTDGVVEEWVGTITDNHEQKSAAERVRISEERYRALIEASASVVWLAAADGAMVGGAGWTALSGQGPNEYSGSGWLKAVHPDDQESVREGWMQAVSSGTACVVQFRIRQGDGTYRWALARAVPLKDQSSAVREWVGTVTDIHDSRIAELKLWQAANHDTLTGLANRALFQARLDEALTQARQAGDSVSLLLIDLDDFKDVNDSFGHDAGDALLKETAARLSAVARDCDTVARLGGDEFAILLAGASKLEHSSTLAEGLIKKLGQPVSYAGQAIVSRASIGVASFPNHDTAPAELMKDADIALYRAKADGRNRVVVYSAEMKAATQQRIALRTEMRAAISRDQVRPYYQPKVCLSTGRVVGFEALARWNHPAKGVLTPSTFGAAFDDPELATMVGKRLIGKVASDMRRWLNGGLSFGRVAINVSHAEFIQPNLADDILRIFDLAKVPTDHFEIEITEKVLLDTRSNAISSVLEKLRGRGVQIALDDFGTGYASLTHLKEFAVDHIKIDRSFVRDIEEDPDDEAIVAAVVGLGRGLNLQVTAEGVETVGQVQRLREMGCDNAQGFFYAKAVAASEVPSLVEELEGSSRRSGAAA